MRKKRLLRTASERPEELYTLVKSDGEVEMMQYRVMFGYRIRAGYVGSCSVEWDWCCADNALLVSITYGIVHELLKQGVDFKELPVCSRIKPWNKDEKFIEKLHNKLEEVGSEVNLISFLKTVGLYQPINVENYDS